MPIQLVQLTDVLFVLAVLEALYEKVNTNAKFKGDSIGLILNLCFVKTVQLN